MEIINSGKNVFEMLDELMNDLNRNDLSLIERLPYVREYERYRDVVANILKSFHIALVLVRISFSDGAKRGYVFLIRGESGEIGKIPASGTVEGYVIDVSKNGSRKILYNPVKFSNPNEVIGRIMEFANMYRKSEERISQLQLLKEADRDYELFYEEVG